MYLNDEPITNFDDDLLNRGEFVARLAQTIRGWVSPDSLVIGVYGPWGSGKSSVLNLLEKELAKPHTERGEDSSPTAVVRFDPWFFNSAEQLLTTFFSTIEKAVHHLSPHNGTLLKAVLHKYADKLSFTLSPEISIGPVKISLPVSKEPLDDTPNQIREQLVNQIKDIQGRVIIMIDNIDRLDPTELMLMLKLVRLCSDFPHFIYVLAFDQKQVDRIIEKQVNIDADFLKKIVQVDINLPAIDQSQVNEFFFNGINRIAGVYAIDFDPEVIERFESIYRRSIQPFIPDLRTAKRYLNAVAFSMPVVRGQVNYGDFLTLEFLRVFFAKVYNEIPKYETELTSSLPASDFGRQERFGVYEQLRQLVRGEVDGESAAPVENLLGALFPAFGAYPENPQAPNGAAPVYPGTSPEGDLCIASPAHFSRYFRLRVSSSEIPFTTIRQFVSLLNMSPPESSTEWLIQRVMEFKGSKRLQQVLDKLIAHAAEINANGKALLSRAILQLSREFEWSEKNQWKSEARSAAGLAILCCPSREPGEYEAYISDLIIKTPSLAFAVLVATKVLTPENHGHIPEPFDRSLVLAVLRNRLHYDLLQKRIDLFRAYPCSFCRILAAWRSEQMLHEPALAEQYLYECLAQNPRAVGLLLAEFLCPEVDSAHPAQLDFERLRQLYDIDRIYAILTACPGDVTRPNSEVSVIHEFLRRYKEIRPHPAE